MHTIIEPKNGVFNINLKEIWRYRELFYIFAWRDIKVRYKQTILGILWSLLQPISQTFIFSIFFGNLARIPSGEIPYPLFVLIGLVFWGFFSGAVTNASNSLKDNENIVKKTYFPRLILPLSSIIVSFVDFGISFALLLIVITLYGYHISVFSLFVIPLGLIVSAVSASGIGFLLSALNVKYRDVRYILPFFIQLVIFLSPVIYPASIIRPVNRYLMAINPMSSVIESARVVLTGKGSFEWNYILISTASALVLLFTGLYYFKKTEKFFADII